MFVFVVGESTMNKTEVEDSILNEISSSEDENEDDEENDDDEHQDIDLVRIKLISLLYIV